MYFFTFECFQLQLQKCFFPMHVYVMKLALHLPSFLWAIPLSWYGGKFQTNVLSETFIVIQKYCITKRSYFKVKIRNFIFSIYVPRTPENITNWTILFIFYGNVWLFFKWKDRGIIKSYWTNWSHKYIQSCFINWQLEFNEMKIKTLYKERTVDWSKPWIV